jgi:ABC-type glucose/galactose transport system permease subunit
VGDDPEAAQLSGVQVKKTLIQVYMLSGLICAFAGWVDDRPHRLGLADLPQRPASATSNRSPLW